MCIYRFNIAVDWKSLDVAAAAAKVDGEYKCVITDKGRSVKVISLTRTH